MATAPPKSCFATVPVRLVSGPSEWVLARQSPPFTPSWRTKHPRVNGASDAAMTRSPRTGADLPRPARGAPPRPAIARRETGVQQDALSGRGSGRGAALTSEIDADANVRTLAQPLIRRFAPSPGRARGQALLPALRGEGTRRARRRLRAEGATRAAGRKRTRPFGAVWSAFGTVRMSFSTRSACVRRRKRRPYPPVFRAFSRACDAKAEKTRARDSVASAGRRKRGRKQRLCGPRPSKPGYDRIRFSANICSRFPMARRPNPTPVPPFGAPSSPDRNSAIQ